MTPFETGQPDSVFYAAGQHAYMIGVFQSDNPYKIAKYKSIWDAGYRFAKKLFEPAPTNTYRQGRPPNLFVRRKDARYTGNTESLSRTH